MKRQIFLVSAFLIILSSVVHADMIEVKGRGFMSGTIISESDNELVFKDNYGETRRFSRAEVTYIEREKNRSSGKIILPSARKSLAGVKKAVVTAKRDVSRAPGDEPVSDLFEQWANSNMSLVDHINALVEQVSQSALDFLFRGEDTSPLIIDIQKRAANLKDYKSQNLLVGGIGMAIMFFGLLGFVVFGFRLIADAFEKSFLWGVAFLAVPLAFAAPLIGGSVGLFVAVPCFASLSFIVIHWRTARPAFVAQIFSGNLVLLGYFVLQMAS